MAAAVKWKIQRSKGFLIAAVCLLLIAASQIMQPLDRYIISAHHAQAQVSLDQDQAADADRGSKKKHFSHTGAPFIRQQQDSNKFTKSAVLQPQPQQFLSRNLRWHHQMRAADFAAQGIAGPFALLGDHEMQHEMQLLPKIVTAWEELKIHLRRKSLQDGFEPPSNKTCFLWLQDCVDLAKHKAIVKAAESFLTQPVLLFRMSVWEAPPKSQQTLQLNLEGYQCPTVDVVVNSGLHLFQNSHKMTRKMIFKLANQLKAVHRFYDGSPLLHQRLESTTLQHLNDKLGGVDVRDLDSAPGEAFVINGRSLYTTSNPTDAARTSMLLQYVPINCTLRDQVLDGTQLGYFTRSVVTPTLLTSIIPFPTRNDIRDGLLRKESLYFTRISEDNRDERLLGTLPNSSITVFRKQAQGISSNDLHPGYARSSLLARITVEKLVTQEVGVTFNSFVENRVLVLVRGCLIHHRAAAGNEHREVRELKPGSLAFLSNTELHALVAAPSAEFISIRWTGQERYSSRFITRRSINEGKQIFEMPVSDLGAINAKTTVLRSGQAYDPENEADCDVVVLVVKGSHLQVIPAQEFLQSNEAVLIPAGEGCIVWNSGALPVTIVVLQLLKKTDGKDSSLLEAAYRTRGKIM